MTEHLWFFSSTWPYSDDYYWVEPSDDYYWVEPYQPYVWPYGCYTQKACQRCGCLIDQWDKFCRFCGAEQKEEKFCPNCGKKIES